MNSDVYKSPYLRCPLPQVVAALYELTLLKRQITALPLEATYLLSCLSTASLVWSLAYLQRV